MSKGIRVIVLNADETVAPDLRAVLLGVRGVRIVAEIDEPAMLSKAVEQFPAEVLLVHLDPNPMAMMEVVAPIIEARKDRIAAIAMSEDRDAQLVMRAMRAGMREFLWKPFPPEQLGEIVQRVGGEAQAIAKSLGKIYTVVGTCGGVGATCLAANVAVELANVEAWAEAPSPDAKPRVALVDMDFRFGQLAMHLDAQPAYTIAELCETHEQVDPRMIEQVALKHATGVHLIARPTDMGQAERISAAQCAGAIAALQEHYDFIVVDMPARLDPTCHAIFDMADVYLFVLQLLVPTVRNTDRMLQEMARNGYAMDRVRLVCNRCGRESGYLEPTDVEATMGRKLDFLVPEDWKTSSTAVNMGSPLLTHAPRSKLRLAYRQIAQMLAGQREEPPASDEESVAERGKPRFWPFAAAKT